MRVLFLFLGLLLACSEAEPQEPLVGPDPNPEPDIAIDLDSIERVIGQKEMKILFIGNSLTYYNNMPLMVEQEGTRAKVSTGTTMVAEPGYAIVDHWNFSQLTQTLIKSELYDYVVIQQGPSSQEEGRRLLIEGGRKYAELSAKHGAKLAYYMVWPSKEYYHTFDAVIANHKEAAYVNQALLCPVGEKWKAYVDRTGLEHYYSGDQFHPSPLGSQLAASVIFEVLNADRMATRKP